MTGVLLALGWTWAATSALTVVTQLLRVTPRPSVFVLQALSWYLLTLALPVAVVAFATGEPWLGAASAVLAVGWVVETVATCRRPAAGTAAPADVVLTLAVANGYKFNARADDAARALLATEADLLAVVEHTPQLHEALVRAGARSRYPHRLEQPRPGRTGVALLSRWPLSGAVVDAGDEPGVDTLVCAGDARLRLLVVHPLAPTHGRDLRSWRRDLAWLRERLVAVRAGEPVVAAGDLNASRWHPAWRALVAGTGFVSAHDALGHPWSTSWPVRRAAPRFVRIDHCLCRGVVPVAVADRVVPGSDHLAQVVRLSVPTGA